MCFIRNLPITMFIKSVSLMEMYIVKISKKCQIYKLSHKSNTLRPVIHIGYQ